MGQKVVKPSTSYKLPLPEEVREEPEGGFSPNVRRLFSAIFALAVLAAPVAVANAQMTEQAAREEANSIFRSELRSTLNFRSNKGLSLTTAVIS